MIMQRLRNWLLGKKELQNFGIPLKSFHVKRRKSWLAVILKAEKKYIITYVIDEKGLDDAVGIELVTTFTNAEGKEHIYSVEPMEVIKKEGNLYTFQVKHSLSNSGSFKVAYRMFPKNVDLPHRQDFCYVRWFN